MIYKTEKELREIISLGKPEEVIDVFLESYLQGLEYNKWLADKILDAIKESVVGQYNDNINTNEPEGEDVYQPIDVSEQMKQWKLDNYKILREPLYPKQSEYLDAVVKGDIDAQQAYIDKCLAIKSKYPKA